MDYVKKKAFETKVNQIGKDLGISNVRKDVSKALGIGGNEGTSSSANPFSLDQQDVPPSNGNRGLFPGTRPTQRDDATAEAVASIANMPGNYPPLLNIFYIDRSILSLVAKAPVGLAHWVFLFTVLGLALNSAIHIVLTVRGRERQWADLISSLFMLFALSFYALVAYFYAFRGAYRSSSSTQAWYLVLGAIHLALLALYAFLGVSFFNGWTRLRNVSGKLENVYKVLAGIEAAYWTFILLFATYALYEYYDFRRSKAQGLSAATLGAFTTVENPGNQFASAPPPPGTRSTVDEIRERYGR